MQTHSHDYALIKSSARRHQWGQHVARDPEPVSTYGVVHGFSQRPVNGRARLSPDPPGASVCVTQVIPPSSVTDHLFLFPFCPRELSKEDTSLTDSIIFKKSRHSVRKDTHHSQEYHLLLPLFFRFLTLTETSPNLKTKTWLLVYYIKNKGHTAIPFLPVNCRFRVT